MKAEELKGAEKYKTQNSGEENVWIKRLMVF